MLLLCIQDTIENAYLLKNKTLYKDINLSEQQIIDCSDSYGNQGCNGGWMTLVYDYIIKYGATTEESYPYTEADG